MILAKRITFESTLGSYESCRLNAAANKRRARERRPLRRRIKGARTRPSLLTSRFQTLDYSPRIDRSSLCYGSHEANRAQIDRRQGAAQAARHKGCAQIGARNRRRQEGEKTFNAPKNLGLKPNF